MAKVTLLPRDVEKIKEIIELNNIVSDIIIECDTSSSIGAIITMSWEEEHNGLNTKMTIELSGVEKW